MRRGNKTERQVWWTNVSCWAVMVLLAVIITVRFSLYSNGCLACFGENIADRILIYILAGLLIAYLISMPVQIYKVRQSRRRQSKIDGSDDSDEGSTSY